MFTKYSWKYIRNNIIFYKYNANYIPHTRTYTTNYNVFISVSHIFALIDMGI